jgi:hypothetical protein
VREVNTLINVLIHTDVQLFAAVKMGFTAAALIFLVIHHRYRIFARLRVNHMLRVVVAAYLVLLVYELALLDSMRLPGSTVPIVIAGISFAVAGFYLDYKQSRP